METDSYTSPRVRGQGKEKKRIQRFTALAELNSSRGLPEPTPCSRSPEHACLGPTCKLSPRMRSCQDPFPDTEKSDAVCSQLSMLWLNKTGRCQASVISVIHMGLPKLLECSPLNSGVFTALGFTVFWVCSGINRRMWKPEQL